ncbi:MAG: adenylyl-sulfate kinase [Candidatus Nanohaloarchaea archaeon]|nr:adenylyl-sulfate kinase [Candidatus Nanohaloarchaea archaeon]
MDETKRNGFTLWFTGLPSSGKSTIAKRVEEELRGRGIEMHNLDGDNVRKKLHPDLGFTEQERATNNRRVSFIARLLNEHNIGVIVAAVSPFQDARENARDEIEEAGSFIEIFTECPVEVCKERDPKGLYEQAEQGQIDNFTGVNHPYEAPDNPEITVNTAEQSPEECVQHVLNRLEDLGVLEERDPHTGLTQQEEDQIKDRLEDLGYLG